MAMPSKRAAEPPQGSAEPPNQEVGGAVQWARGRRSPPGIWRSREGRRLLHGQIPSSGAPTLPSGPAHHETRCAHKASPAPPTASAGRLPCLRRMRWHRRHQPARAADNFGMSGGSRCCVVMLPLHLSFRPQESTCLPQYVVLELRCASAQPGSEHKQPCVCPHKVRRGRANERRQGATRTSPERERERDRTEIEKEREREQHKIDNKNKGRTCGCNGHRGWRPRLGRRRLWAPPGRGVANQGGLVRLPSPLVERRIRPHGTKDIRHCVLCPLSQLHLPCFRSRPPTVVHQRESRQCMATAAGL